jgi:Lrp/AsnC family transcriptional regulator for asnA, asnC and gidA
MQTPMDDLDRLILQTLQQDGRTPFTHIARQAGVSETTVRLRYRALVEAG